MMKYESYVMKKSILFFSLITLCISMLSACGGRSASGSDDINPRDTVTVPEGYTGEDSIAYIENVVLKDHISMNDFLELAEVHELEDRLFTVTAKEWEQWIADNSVPEDIDDLKKMGDTDRIPSDTLVADRVNTLMSTFGRWLKARQALATALPKEQGDSYDYLTADIHSRMVGKLAAIIPYENW